MDGMIKFWNYRAVDLADPPENDRILEIEPSFTIKIEDSINDAKIMGMCKTNGDSNSQSYFIQVNFKGVSLYLTYNDTSAKQFRQFYVFWCNHRNILVFKF